METWRIALTIVGGLFGLAAITSAAIQAARGRLKTQRIDELTSFVGMYDLIVHGEDSPQGRAELERQRQYEVETGRRWGSPDPKLTVIDVVRGEFTVPVVLGVVSVVAATLASLIPPD